MAHKGPRHDTREIGCLTDPYLFEGYAWYSRTVSLCDADLASQIILYLERTRLTKVWVDDMPVGSFDSLTTPHQYDLTPYIKSNCFRLTILVSNVDYPTKGGHLTSPDTQTNWNGIIGEIALHLYDAISIRQIRTFPDIQAKTVTVELHTCNLSTEEVSRTVHIHARQKDLHGYTGHDAKEKVCTVNFPAGENVTSVNYPRGDDAVLWSAGETFCADVALRYYHPASLNRKCIDWSLTCGNTVAASGSIELPEETHGLHSCGTISFSCPACKKAAMYQLNLSIAETGIQNHYKLYLYPAMDSVDLSVPQITRNGHSISLTNDWKQACALLSEGKRVLYLPEEVSESLEGFYCTDFWCYPMFRDICNWMKKPVAVGTNERIPGSGCIGCLDFASRSFGATSSCIGWYPVFSITVRIACFFSSLTYPSFRYLDTVARDTPANRAISLIFIRCPATFLSHALFILCHVIRS